MLRLSRDLRRALMPSLSSAVKHRANHNPPRQLTPAAVTRADGTPSPNVKWKGGAAGGGNSFTGCVAGFYEPSSSINRKASEVSKWTGQMLNVPRLGVIDVFEPDRGIGFIRYLESETVAELSPPTSDATEGKKEEDNSSNDVTVGDADDERSDAVHALKLMDEGDFFSDGGGSGEHAEGDSDVKSKAPIFFAYHMRNVSVDVSRASDGSRLPKMVVVGSKVRFSLQYHSPSNSFEATNVTAPDGLPLQQGSEQDAEAVVARRHEHHGTEQSNHPGDMKTQRLNNIVDFSPGGAAAARRLRNTDQFDESFPM